MNFNKQKIFILFILPIFFSLEYQFLSGHDDLVLQEGFIKALNEDPTSTWVAGINSKFIGWTNKEAAALLMPISESNSVDSDFWKGKRFLKNEGKENRLPPFKYDFYEKYDHCKQPVRDQGHCGSCWAFSATEAIEDRICRNSSKVIRLSPQDFVSCDLDDLGCGGGNFDKLWRYAEMEGIVSDKCFPYQSSHGYRPACIKMCRGIEQWEKSKHYVGYTQHVDGTGFSPAQEIYDRGPVQAGFRVYQDFYSYKSGIYRYSGGKQLGNHAIKITGWGSGNGTNGNFWIVQNSWGDEWGMDGYFWIAKGTNMCGIESNIYAPDMISNFKLH